MRLVDSHQMQKMDRYTIDKIGIDARVLMENAGRSWIAAVAASLRKDSQIRVLCGSGNNGGDGYVIARNLKSRGYDCTVIVIAEPGSEDCLVNSRIWQFYGESITWQKWIEKKMRPSDSTIWVDAILGTGISTPIRPKLRSVIEQINAYPGEKIAVDIPSGINASTGDLLGCAINANKTITFQKEKVGHHLYPGKTSAGKLYCQNISIMEHFEEGAPAYHLIDKELLHDRLPVRNPEAYKNNFGHMAVYCGQPGMMGAAWLAAYSGLKTGAGLSTAVILDDEQNSFWLKAPELMSISREKISTEKLNTFDALVVGCGLGRDPLFWSEMNLTLQQIKKPMVLDADCFYGLNNWNQLPLENIVLTPHAGEFEKLSGYSKPENNGERMSQGVEFIRRYPTTLVLKGAPTLVIDQNETIYINSTGNVGMATAGSGDVLSGIIGGFLAQGLSPLWAAIAGTWFHGRSGDITRSVASEASLSANDLIDNLHKVWRDINERNNQF
ncbi:MAG: NAD(P)H-hydrate dehydratase [Proteobacteria bacterium]|nr:NAD(P)H-hydrate dehydratase [Pseudomonadota bacterium]